MRCGADDVLEHAEDVGLELLDVRAVEDRPADADHAGPDLRDAHLRRRRAQRGQPEKTEAQRESEASARHGISTHYRGRPPQNVVYCTYFVQLRVLLAALAEQHDLPVIDLRQVTPSPEALNLLPEVKARALQAIPVSVADGTITLAVADPTHRSRRRSAPRLGRRCSVTPQAIVRAIGTNLPRAHRSTPGPGLRGARRAAPRRAGWRRRRRNDDAPVVQVVKLLITQALRDRASDIHIEPQDDRVRVRFRIDGALHEVLDAARPRWARRSSAASRSWPT